VLPASALKVMALLSVDACMRLQVGVGCHNSSSSACSACCLVRVCFRTLRCVWGGGGSVGGALNIDAPLNPSRPSIGWSVNGLWVLMVVGFQ
jgi:hypothetical protein